jgi:GAF domain-containing protein
MPMSAREVRQALHELGDLRYAAGDLDDAVRRIVHATHKLFAVDGAGLMLIDPDQLLRNVADSDGRVDHLEELQIEHGEGPCIDAFDDKQLVHAADLAEEKRWPDFSPAAVERGLRAVLASPIPYNQMAIGVVAVYSAKVRPWSPEVVIEQAKGALCARDGVTPGQAFEQMRRRARAERRRVLEIAQEIMSGSDSR